MIEFILLVNKAGQTRFAKYYKRQEARVRIPLEAEVARKCLARTDSQVPINISCVRLPMCGIFELYRTKIK